RLVLCRPTRLLETLVQLVDPPPVTFRIGFPISAGIARWGLHLPMLPNVVAITLHRPIARGCLGGQGYPVKERISFTSQVVKPPVRASSRRTWRRRHARPEARGRPPSRDTGASPPRRRP